MKRQVSGEGRHAWAPGRRRGWAWIAAAGVSGWLAFAACAAAADGAVSRTDSVVVLYNSEMKDSRSVAEYYAERRNIPEERRIGLSLPETEVISRSNFTARLEGPLVVELKRRGLIDLRDEVRPATETAPGRVVEVLRSAKVRTLVVCYGVPLRVAEDAGRREPEAAVIPEQLRRNEAAVDAELTALPFLLAGHPIIGPMVNPWMGSTNAADMHPANGVFVVGRLDGPTPELARGLVDKALDAEQQGLLGRGYFDIRSIADGPYQPGDQWISNAWKAVSRYGFDTYLDRRPETLAAGFPLSHVAFYAGWYDANVSGPFLPAKLEFMPGAVAYHLHSFSAPTLRSADRGWVGPLIARGVTATMGTVAEPYLDGTPDVGLCYARLMFSGFTWGEAALASQRMLSWQLTVVGDPLYRPFGASMLERAKSLSSAGQGRIDWALVMLYNRKREATGDLAAVMADLGKEPRLKFSPVLQEKLGDWQREAGDHAAAAETYRRATAWKVSPQQRIRLLWHAAEDFQAAGKLEEAYELFGEVATSAKPPPDAALLYERLQSMAQALDRKRDAERWGEALDRLRSAAGNAGR
ncbi:MAG: TIGR03790 family protein [Verrucomicrobiales bacterium]|nr:TIGR03790 family protein [Verrucomicrobiales bacterium]